MEDKILNLASEKRAHEVNRSENFDSKATNLIATLGVVVTLMGSLFTYALITFNPSGPLAPHREFYPILISGLVSLLISIGLALLVINPVGKKVMIKLDLQDFHNRHKNDPDETQTKEELIKYYYDFTNEMHDFNEEKSAFYKWSTIFALVGLTLFGIAASILFAAYML